MARQISILLATTVLLGAAGHALYHYLLFGDVILSWAMR